MTNENLGNPVSGRICEYCGKHGTYHLGAIYAIDGHYLHATHAAKFRAGKTYLSKELTRSRRYATAAATIRNVLRDVQDGSDLRDDCERVADYLDVISREAK